MSDLSYEYTLRSSQQSSQRWLIFVLITLSYLLIFTQRTGPGVISNHLQVVFHVTSAQLGMISSIQYLLYMILQIPVGVLADRLGPARLLVVGMMLDGIGTLGFSLSNSFSILLVSRAVVGFGDALIWVNIVLILGRRFAPTEFGAVLGMVGTGGNLGALLTTIPLASWIAAAGWRVPFGVLGASILAVGLADFTVLNGLKPRRNTALALTTQAINPEPGIRVQPVQVRALLGIVVKDKLSWFTFMCHCGSMGAYLGFTSVWAVPYFMDIYGISRVVASTFSFAAFLGAMVGGPVTGAISDKLKKRRGPYIVLQSIGLIAWLSFTVFDGSPPKAWAYIAMFLIGCLCGASLLTFAVIRDQVPAERSGVASGFANTGGYLSAVLVPVLFGMVIDQLGHPAPSMSAMHHVYAHAFLIPCCCSAIGVLGSLLIRDKVNV